MIMDRDDGIFVEFYQGADGIGHTFLHFRIGSLHGIEFDAAAGGAGIGGGNGGSAHADAVIIAAEQDDEIAGGGCFLDGLRAFAGANAAGQHNHFIEAQFALVFFVFEGIDRACDEWLAEFITKIGSPIRGFDEDIQGCLV